MSHTLFRAAALALSVALHGLPAAAAPSPAAPEKVTEMGGIEEYRLPNGLQVLLFPDPSQTTATVNITYRVGSRAESVGEYGSAHLLEHLLFKGTERQRDIPGEMARRGVRFNGTTNADRTNYFASFNADPATLAFLIELEADRMAHSRLAKEDLDKEMTVVRNEFERGENESMLALVQRVKSAAYTWHPYGHTAISPRSDIENMPIESLQRFYRRFYRPDNATLLIAGAFDKSAALQLVTQHFGPLKAPAEPVPVIRTVEPAQDGERSVVVRRVGGQAAVLAAYHVPGSAHPDMPALIVYGLLMSLEPSGQLYKELVASKLTQMAGIGVSGEVDGGLAFAIAAGAGDGSAVESRLLQLAEGRAGLTFDESDLARVRELAAAKSREQLKNPDGLVHAMSNAVAAGDWRLPFRLMQDIPNVTLADVERVRKAYFRPANRTVGRYIPTDTIERVEIPPTPPIAERMAGLTGPAAVEEGEQLDPTPAVLESRTTGTTLPSGIVLHTLRKQTRGNAVQAQLHLRWADRDTTFPRPGTDVIAALLLEGSLRTSRQQVQDTLLRLHAQVRFRSNDQYVTATVTAERDTLLPTLALVAELMREPALPRDAFDRHQKGAIARLQASRHEPEPLRADAVRAHYNQARGVSYPHPDYDRSLDDIIYSVQRTTRDDLVAFHADYWSANDMQASVAGALPDGLAHEMERLFGDWKKPSTPRYQRHVPTLVAVPAARFDAVARDKASAVVQFQQEIALSDADADFPAFVIAAHVFGSGALESRLAERLRQKEGLTYGVRASFDAPHFGRAGRLRITTTCAPAARDRVIAAIQEELARMTAAGITEAELTRALKDIGEARRLRRADLTALAAETATLADLGETWLDVGVREEAFTRVTTEAALQAWRQRIDPAGFVISAAGDSK